MSFENLSEVLWSTPGGKGLFGLFDHHPTNSNSNNFNGTDGLSLFYNDPIPGVGDGTSNGTPNNFLVGISIAVGTSFIQSLGLTIQRKSHVINEAIHPKELRRQACHRPLWHLGFHTYILSNLTGTIFSIGYLPVIILAPLGAVTLVFNALFARLLLGDTFSRQSAAGTFLILLGAIMIGLFGVVPEPSHSLEDLIELWKRPAFIIYFSLIELTVVSLLVANRIVEKMLTKNAQASLAAHQRTGSVSDIVGGGGAGPINNNSLNHDMHSGPYGKLLGNRAFGKLSPTKIKTILGISYGCVGGMLSSQALLFAKSAIELLYLTIVEGQNQFENPLSWFLVVALITAALLQLYYLNQGLRLCDTVLLVPLSFCAYNVSCLFNGLVYYNQWGRLYWWQILLILFGISQVLIGVLVLAWRPTAGEEYLDGDGDEATLLLPNASRPATPRHSRVFSFKGVSGGGGTGAGIGGGGGGHGQDPSADARNLILGFEMYDSDEDDGLDQDENNNNKPLERQPHRRVVSVQDPRLLSRASEHHQSESDSLQAPPPLQSSKSLTFAPNNRRPSK
ncbi:hypothetical protein EC957_008543 [Mortierella hygrophila]|uniref:Magnesium transporter NIPA-domain-containing protein n=1 Tax=Mortierella hygrophila TaxID=979708 RepID=A0A9P6FC47_9FUNG|nr:hypothetical protein EC957_008543 [Mortierella hygrophila]